MHGVAAPVFRAKGVDQVMAGNGHELLGDASLRSVDYRVKIKLYSNSVL